jgi:hypothetical protein
MGVGVRIGYYRADSASTTCDATQPENLAAGALTHINVGYEYIGEDGLLTEYNGAIMARVARLKRRYDGLRVNLVIGGYDFTHPDNNDPNDFSNGTTDVVERWHNMTDNVPDQQSFITSLVAYMNKYAVDGVDLGKFQAYRFLHCSSIILTKVNFHQIGSIRRQNLLLAMCQVTTTISWFLSPISAKPLTLQVGAGRSRFPFRTTMMIFGASHSRN